MNNLQVLFLGLIGLAFLGSVGFLATRKRADDAPYVYVPPEEIARIEEVVTFSAGGGWAVAMLVVCNFFAVFAYYLSANVMQQIVATLVWVGWNVLWGTGAIIGRKRVYRVLRDAAPPSERVEPRA